jgi:hypothetical protein
MATTDWGFTLPPPFTPPFDVIMPPGLPTTESVFAVPWQNLTSQVWGSHVYCECSF